MFSFSTSPWSLYFFSTALTQYCLHIDWKSLSFLTLLRSLFSQLLTYYQNDFLKFHMSWVSFLLRGWVCLNYWVFAYQQLSAEVNCSIGELFNVKDLTDVFSSTRSLFSVYLLLWWLLPYISWAVLFLNSVLLV